MSHYQLSWPLTFLLAYTLGGVCNHSLTLAMHEVSHNLAFKSLFANRLFGIFVNLPMGIPAFASFKRYHTDHHKYQVRCSLAMGRRVCVGRALAGLTRYVLCLLQGEDEVDTDIPTAVEGRFFTNPLLKAFWMLIQVCGGTCLCHAWWCMPPVTMSLTSLPRPQPLFYALRPMFTVPKVPGKWELINVAAAVAFDATVYRFCGLQSVVYLVFSTLLGMGLHPMAGHFVAEHYAFVTGQETYSYYGPLNWFSYFVGYHNEHHDFPFIAGACVAGCVAVWLCGYVAVALRVCAGD